MACLVMSSTPVEEDLASNAAKSGIYFYQVQDLVCLEREITACVAFLPPEEGHARTLCNEGHFSR